MERPELAQWRLVDFVKELAAGTPMPGGGCAVAVAGALAAALGALAAKISDKRRATEESRRVFAPLLQELEEAQEALLQLADEDALAYQEVVLALRRPRSTPAEQKSRRQAVQQAFLAASRPPLALARWGLRLLELAVTLAREGERVILADIGVMGYLAQAVVQGGWVNVQANLQMAPPAAPETAKLRQELEDLTARLPGLAADFAALLAQRLQDWK